MKKFLAFIRNRYFKFVLAGTLYILWVIWLGNFWFLLGLPIVYDIYVSKKVNWAFWKRRDRKNSSLVEWIDALIFAVIAVTLINIFLFQNYKIPTGSMEKSLLIGDHLFVSKLAYGPKMPNTPLSFPFTQHTLPIIKRKSYVEWIKWPYHRLAGFRKVKNDDVVVFNFPAGDTVVIERQAESYGGIVRDIAEQYRSRDFNTGAIVQPLAYYLTKARRDVWKNYTVISRPVDRRDNYIKRCIGVPGDRIEIRHRQVYVNNKPQKPIKDMQFQYYVITNGTAINPKVFERIGIAKNDVSMDVVTNEYIIPLTAENATKLSALNNVKKVICMEDDSGLYEYYIFPGDPHYRWNRDNFGPLDIPARGQTVNLTTENICFYERIITAYEGNTLEVKNSKIFINGKETNTYTFAMNYYWMMGDNRHDSADSRYWGFVPEDHIVGSPKLIWLSLDKNKPFPQKIRLKRMFRSVH
jgi:signal peptidase I